ncbi:54S ribosomal protein L12, mitochondrial [Sorochytrium milnesiophthora]
MFARLVSRSARCVPRCSPLPVFNNKHGGRLYSTPAPESQQQAPQPNAALENIVSQISKLTLLETADLVTLLKARLNISEVAMPVAAAAAPAAAAAAGPAAPAEEEKPAEKTQFNVMLEKFDAATKAKVIKEIKAIVPGINLIEAKKFVEGAPKLVKENATKEEAEKIKKALEAAGATVSLQ